MTERIKALESGKINKLIANFSIPAIIGMMVMASYNVVDRIFVGRGVGTLAISGIAITFPVNIIVMAFGMLVGMGATSLISLKLGEKKKEDAEKILNYAFYLSIIVSLFLTLGVYFAMDPLIVLFGGTGEVYNYADQFLRIFVWGIPFQFIAFALNATIRAQGDPKTALWTMMISGILNIILNPIFIMVFHLGVRGSALATLIAQLVGSIWVVAYFTSNRSFIKIRFRIPDIDFKIIKRMLSIGFSPFIMQIAGSMIIFIFNRSLLAYGGDTAVAAMAIGNSVVMLIMMPIFGLNQGIQPIIGFNYGAKQIHRVKETLGKGIFVATIICTVGFFAIMLYATNIIGFFSSGDLNLVSMGAHGMKIYLLMLPLSGFQIVSWAYFQAVGKPKQSLMLTLLKQVLLIIPLLLILPYFYKLDGIWMAGPVADFISAIIAGTFLFFEIRKLNSLKSKVVLTNQKTDLIKN
jgi:putative MATE family efflux protein